MDYKKITLVTIITVALFLAMAQMVDSTAPVFTLNSSWVDSGTWYDGAVHVHQSSGGDDGVNTPLVVGQAYHDAGYDFLFYTPHNAIINPPTVEGILLMKGMEASGYNDSDTGGLNGNSSITHMGLIGITTAPASLYYEPNKIITEAHTQGGLAILNHPDTVTYCTPGFLDYLQGLDAFEWDGLGVTGQRDVNVYAYDYYLSHGKRAWIIVGEDEHNVTNGLKYWKTVANAPTLTQDDIIDAIQQGHFYASMENATISDIAVSGHTITITLPESGTVRWVKANNVTIKTDTGVTSATYTADGTETYIRMEVEYGGLKIALSQPIYIETGLTNVPAITSPVTSGLVASYNFTHDSGATVVDDSGNDLDGTSTSLTYSTGPSGKSVVVFDGVNSRISVNHNSLLNLTNYTIGVMYKPWTGSSTGDKYLVSKGTLYTDNYAMYYSMTSNLVVNHFSKADTSEVSIWNYAPHQNQWYFDFISYNNYTQKVYINGQLDSYKYNGTAGTLGTPQVNDLALNIGGANNKRINASIGRVVIFNRGLSDAEILQEYRAYSYEMSDLTADFSANVTMGIDRLDVQFSDDSTGIPSTWQWNFGDGTANSTEENPIHTYTSLGTYNVTLTVTNPDDSSTTQKTSYIFVTEIYPSFTISSSSTTVTESDTTITLTITKNRTTTNTYNVTIATADGTATQPSDYTQINQVLSFTGAQQSKTVVLSIKGHPIQTDRTFTVALINPTGNATLGSPSSILITIQPKSEIMEGGVVIAQYWPVFVVILFVGFIIAATVVMLMLLRSGRGNPNMLIMISLVSGVTIIIVAVIAFVGTMLYNGLFGGL